MAIFHWARSAEACNAIKIGIENDESIYCLEILGVKLKHLSTLDNQGIFKLCQIIDSDPKTIMSMYNGIGHIAAREIKAALGKFHLYTKEAEEQYIISLYMDNKAWI